MATSVPAVKYKVEILANIILFGVTEKKENFEPTIQSSSIALS